jgi:hypothetical protein
MNKCNHRKINKTTIAVISTLLILSIAASLNPVTAQSSPTIELLPPAAPPGTPITVQGAGFTPGATVDLHWFGFILDTPDVIGHIGYYPIKTGVNVETDGRFTTTIIAPYDFSDFIHFINATQNGVGTGTLASFVIAPALQLSPQPANYAEGQEVTLNVYGAPLGTAAVMMGLPTMAPEVSVLKFTYDNNEWGFVTSHLETEGPITTGPDIGGNATIRFKTVGGVGKHHIRAYTGGKETMPYLSCEVGGEIEFSIVGPGLDTETILGDVDNVEGLANNAANYSLVAIATSIVNLLILLFIANRRA